MVINDIDAKTKEFLNKIKNPPVYKRSESFLHELSWKEDDSGNWRKKYGIYVIADESNQLYIGRAYGTSFGARLAEHLNEKKYVDAIEWGQVIRSPKSKLILYSFDCPVEQYWIAALELCLIDAFKPKHNAKNG